MYMCTLCAVKGWLVVAAACSGCNLDDARTPQEWGQMWLPWVIYSTC